MKKLIIPVLALGLTALGSVASVTGALAQAPETQFYGQNRDGQNRDGQSRDWQSRGGGAWSRNNFQDFTGMWRLDSRDGNQGGNGRGDWNNGRNGGWGRGNDRRYRDANYLPDVIQIERDRRQLVVENQRGDVLRQVAMRRNADVRSFRTQTGGPGGASVTETFSLIDRGRRLMVRTTINGRFGPRDFTTVYERA